MIGTGATLVSVSGCLGAVDSLTGSDPSDESTGSEFEDGDTSQQGPGDELSFDRTDADPEPPDDPDEPIATSRIGGSDADGPSHRVRIWNLAADPRTVAIELESTAERTQNTSIDGRYTLSPERHVVIELRDRGAYEFTVTVDGEVLGDDGQPIAIEADRFDEPCPITDVFVGERSDIAVEMRAEDGNC